MKVKNEKGLVYDCPEEYAESFLNNGWEEVAPEESTEEPEAQKKATAKK